MMVMGSRQKNISTHPVVDLQLSSRCCELLVDGLDLVQRLLVIAAVRRVHCSSKMKLRLHPPIFTDTMVQ